jgi:hypothetical protein
MAVWQEAETIPFSGQGATARSFPPELVALKRSCQFYRFLRDELETCRTETEKEVVLSALLTAQMNVERLVRSLRLHFRVAG